MEQPPSKEHNESNASHEFELTTKHLVMPSALNPNYSIFGGQLLAWLDMDLYLYVSGKVACKNMVTVSMDKVYFKNPAFLGEMIEIRAALHRVRRTSVTALGKAEAYNPETGDRRLIIECEITYVAVDSNGKPVPVDSAKRYGHSGNRTDGNRSGSHE